MLNNWTTNPHTSHLSTEEGLISPTFLSGYKFWKGLVVLFMKTNAILNDKRSKFLAVSFVHCGGAFWSKKYVRICKILNFEHVLWSLVHKPGQTYTTITNFCWKDEYLTIKSFGQLTQLKEIFLHDFPPEILILVLNFKSKRKHRWFILHKTKF